MNLYAGGIRNPCATSYLNSTLQFLLHFKPLTDLLSDSEYSKNYLVKVLYRLYIKIKETSNNISADSLISYFQIDPQYSSNVLNFISLLYSNLPTDFHQIIFLSDIISVENPINIEDFTSNIPDNSILNTHKMIIFKVQTNSDTDQLIHLNSEDQIFINDDSYQLYGFIQRRGTQYHFIMHDSEGWINCNDSSLSSISIEQVTSFLSDPRMPIELIIFIKDISMIEFSRRRPVFQDIRNPVNFSSAASTQEDSQIYPDSSIFSTNDYFSFSSSEPSQSNNNNNNAFLEKYRQNENQLITKLDKRTDFIIQSKIMHRNPSSVQSYSFNFNEKGNTDSTRNTHFLDSNDSFVTEYDEIEDQKEEEENDDVLPLDKDYENESKYLIGDYINPKTNQLIKRYEYKLENQDYKEAAETIKYQFEADYQETFEYYFKFGSKYTNSVPPSSESQAYAIFRPTNNETKRQLLIKYPNKERKEQDKYKVSIKIIGITTKQINRQFKGNQKLSDVKTLIELYLSIKDQPIYFFITINNKEFRVLDENKYIKELWMIANHQIELTVTLESNPQKIGSFQIPLYQTFGHFKLVKTIQLYINIDDTCQHLIDYAQKIMKTQLEIMTFDDIKKEFIPFQHEEKLYKVFNYPNLRIQPPIPNDSIIFLHEVPFTYSIKDGQTLRGLKNEIQQYLDLKKDFYLEYNQKVFNSYNYPKIAWKKGLFKFMVIRFGPKRGADTVR